MSKINNIPVSVPEQFKKVSYYLSAGFVVIGLFVLACWIIGFEKLKFLPPQLATIKVNTAICFLLSGLIMLLQQQVNKKPKVGYFISIFAVVVFLIGTLTLLEYSLKMDLGIDELFFTDAHNAISTLYPGRQTPLNALFFLLFGLSFFPYLRAIKSPPVGQILILLIGMTAFITAVTYLFSTGKTYENYSYLSTSFQTSFTFILLVLAALFLKPDEGLMKIISSSSIGGRLFRVIFPLSLVIFLLFGWLVYRGELAGYYIPEFGFSIFIIGSVIIFTLLLFQTAINLNSRETAQKRTESALLTSEEKYRTLIEQASDAILIVDNLLNYIEVNNRACNMFGYSREAFLKLNVADITVLDDQAPTLRFDELSGGGSIILERNFRCKDGSVLPVEISGSKMYNGSYLAIVRDISERKKAERALIASEEQYRTLVEQASDAIFITDAAGNFITVNKSTLRMTQLTEEEMLRMNYHEFLFEDDVKNNPLHLQELAEGKTVVTERILKSKNNQTLDVEITSKLLSNGNLLTFAKDIAERKRQQQQLKESEQRLLRAESMGKLGHGFYDFINNRMQISAGLYAIWGVQQKEFSHTAEGLKNMIHPDDHVLMDKAFVALQKQGEVEVEFRIVQPSGDVRNVFFKTMLSRNQQNEMISSFTTAVDITDTKKVQEEIEIYNEKLRLLTAHLQSVREEERRRIGREIHDDLGQQLTAIKMDAAWIDKNTPAESEKIKTKLKNIISLLDASNSSVRRILSELKPSILDEYGLIEAIDLLGIQFTKNTGIPVAFQCNEKRLQLPETTSTCVFRVIQESLTNITRYAQAKNVTISLKLSSTKLTVVIKDDGVGFDSAILKTKTSFGILGMHERVRALAGFFNLQSTVEKGTEIIIILPVQQRATEVKS